MDGRDGPAPLLWLDSRLRIELDTYRGNGEWAPSEPYGGVVVLGEALEGRSACDGG